MVRKYKNSFEIKQGALSDGGKDIARIKDGQERKRTAPMAAPLRVDNVPKTATPAIRTFSIDSKQYIQDENLTQTQIAIAAQNARGDEYESTPAKRVSPGLIFLVVALIVMVCSLALVWMRSAGIDLFNRDQVISTGPDITTLERYNSLLPTTALSLQQATSLTIVNEKTVSEAIEMQMSENNAIGFHEILFADAGLGNAQKVAPAEFLEDFMSDFDALARFSVTDYAYGYFASSNDALDRYIILQTTSPESMKAALYDWEPLMNRDIRGLLKPLNDASPSGVFVDSVMEARDVRQAENGLMYGFVNDTTVVVAENEKVFTNISSLFPRNN